MTQQAPGKLWIVATPIGNLDDLSARAQTILRQVDLVAAEDTRHSAALLQHYGIATRRVALHEHNEREVSADLVRQMRDGMQIALVSDAGTPLISDPGYKLVRATRQAGHVVYTIPGPSAAIAALTLAALPTDRFLFLGFLPARAKARADAIAEVALIRATLVLYESGPRLADTLAELARQLGPRDAAVARELTKLHEECVTSSLADLAERYENLAPKGEIVIVVGPPADEPEATGDELDAALRDALTRLSPSRAAADVAEALGVPRKRAYARALELAGK